MKRVVLASVSAIFAIAGPAGAEEQNPISHLLAPLLPGQQVKVQGSSVAGVFHATLIALRDAEPVAQVEGTIEWASSDRRRLQVLGFEVTLDAATQLYRGSRRSSSPSMLTRGTWIQAKGLWREGVLTAARIRMKETPAAAEEIEGAIESFERDTSILVIQSRRIVVDNRVVIVDERTTSAPSRDRLRREDDDGQSRAPLEFGNVVLGGRVEAGYLDEQNFTVGDAGAERTVLSRMQVLASSQMTDTVEAYTKATLSRNVGSSAQRDVRLSEAYLLFHQIGETPLALQIGRQRFRDFREWMFDEYLDAVRVHASLPLVKLEAAVSQGLSSGPAEVRARRDQLQFIGSASARAGRARLAFHAISRRDDTRAERPVWLAATVEGRSGRSVSYWADLALQRGAARAARFAGWALDTGARHTWTGAWRPTVTAGYAFGSGDDTPSDGVDTRFRQTDLEDNQAYFGGLRRVAIYGELLDPELSNLHVITIGLGVQPRRGFAVDAIYHEFVQAKALPSLASVGLDRVPTGTHRAIGREVDVVLTIRATRGVDIDVASGLFLPGRAFETGTTPAFFWRPQLRFYF